jgi:hypothetical protein
MKEVEQGQSEAKGEGRGAIREVTKAREDANGGCRGRSSGSRSRYTKRLIRRVGKEEKSPVEERQEIILRMWKTKEIKRCKERWTVLRPASPAPALLFSPLCCPLFRSPLLDLFLSLSCFISAYLSLIFSSQSLSVCSDFLVALSCSDLARFLVAFSLTRSGRMRCGSTPLYGDHLRR